MLRMQVIGIVDQAALDAVAAELSKDRQVLRLADGSLRTQDDLGFQPAFRVAAPSTCRPRRSTPTTTPHVPSTRSG